MKYTGYLLMIPFLLLLGCQGENVIEYESYTYERPAQVLFNTTVTGKILNEKGFPVQQCEVKINNRLSYTDDNGEYFLQDVAIDSLGQMMEISKSGFESKYVFILPVLNDVVIRDVTLYPSITKNRVTLDQTYKVSRADIVASLEAGTFSDNMHLYDIDFIVQNATGDVDFPFNIPYLNKVSLVYAIPKTGFFIEARDASTGLLPPTQQKLIEVNLSEYLKRDTDSDLALFYYDKKQQLFIQDEEEDVLSGKVGIKGNTYYLIGSKGSNNAISIQLKNIQQSEISNVRYYIKDKDKPEYKAVYTDDEGKINCVLPKQKEFVLYQRDICGNYYSVSNLLSQNGWNSIITDPKAIILELDLLDCYWEYLSTATYLEVILEANGTEYRAAANSGKIKENIFLCDPNVTLTVRQGEEIVVEKDIVFDPGKGYSGQILPTNCEGTVSFITIGDENLALESSNLYVFFDPIGSDNLTITDFNTLFLHQKLFTGEGSYKPSRLTVFGKQKFAECENTCQNIEMIVHKFGAPGEECIFSLSGKVEGAKVKGFIKTNRYN